MRIDLCLLTWNELIGCQHDIPQLPREPFGWVFAVDNHSSDGTPEYLRSQGIEVVPQALPTYNGAYISAFQNSSADAVVFFHPKGSVDPAVVRTFPPLLAAGYDLVVASRIIVGGTNEEDARLLRPRKTFVRALAVAARVLWMREGKMIWDVLHGIRGVRREAFFAIDPLPRGASIDLELVVRCYRRRLARVEFPVRERPRPAGVTHFPAWTTGWRLLRYLCTELGRPA